MAHTHSLRLGDNKYVPVTKVDPFVNAMSLSNVLKQNAIPTCERMDGILGAAFKCVRETLEDLFNAKKPK